MKVQDVMTNNVKTCHPETDLATAATMMLEGDYGAMPVINYIGMVVGMITDRDISIAVATKGRRASAIPVGEVISGRTYFCALDEDLKSALKTMRHDKVKRLPVVDHEGRLQGLLCLNDIILRAEEARGKYVPEISYEDAMSTMKAICEHRPRSAAAGA